MPKLEKNGVIKIVSEGTLKVLGDNLDGWRIVRDNIKPYPLKRKFSPVKEKEENHKEEEGELTEDLLRNKIKEAGIKVHHKTGFEKLKKIYDEQVANNKE